MIMKKLSYYFATIAMLAMMFSCGQNGKGSLQEQFDSLQVAYQQQSADYEELNGFLTVIADGMDSIAVQQGMIFKQGEMPTTDRAQIKQNLDAFRQTLAAQRQRIADLEQKLKTGDAKYAKLSAIVTRLQGELAQKDAEMELLRAQIDDQNKSIEELMSSNKALLIQTSDQASYINEQEEALQAQTDMLNTAYVKIGTKKELKELGLTEGGNLFKKKKVKYATMDEKSFEKIDISQKKRFEINSKNPRILTATPPNGSYTVEAAGDKTILTVTNPAKFWSVSNYLIIQTD